MRLQHLEQIAGGLSADDPARMTAKAVIVAEATVGFAMLMHPEFAVTRHTCL